MRGKTVLLTGAAGVIGQATARLLHRNGASLLLVDRDAEQLRRLATAYPDGEVAFAEADVSDPAGARDAFTAASSRFGKLDVAVLAAGIEGPIGPIETCDDAAFDAVMAANVKAVWLMLKQCLPTMKERGTGAVVVLSSISGVTGTPLMAAYSASKHAVLGLVRATAREVAAAGVRVNAVCPGPVASSMMNRIDEFLAERYPGRVAGEANASKFVPLQRYALPEEVAEVILFLSSDASSYCTGSSYTVDGGITLK